ncbi:MAG: UDP-N-acetylmuramoyl-L-alanine--D-glutamate ligase [Bacteroidales bacterium]|jgi:UDP-N-acetylmuramoylalanine--D-glutamate ligase|nr:UDP-N-acetylmuramoyl-L-alanine--D-glutamate ligase [Bacteroidales bacterium]
MFSAIDKIFADKKCIGILGMGREGMSSYALLRRYYPDKELFLFDEREDFLSRMPELSEDKYVQMLTGERIYEFIETERNIDFILKTPGISLKNHPLLKSDPRMSSQTEVFLTLFGAQCIGVTGTKGKSTTTHLIYHLLKTAGKPVLLAGNMGIPFFDVISEINTDVIIVCELSSHQLESVYHAPYTGVLLNLFEEHLDHYVDFLAYQRAKMNIFGKLKDVPFAGIYSAKKSDISSMGDVGGNIAIYNADDVLIAERFREIKFNGIKIPFGTSVAGTAISESPSDSSSEKNASTFDMQELLSTPCALIGKHNAMNKQAAILAVRAAGVTDEQIKNGLKTFKTLPHRLQYIGKVNGIHFYNDSISTIPQAAIAAIESVGTQHKVGSVILGGLDRGIDYSALTEYLQKNPIKNIAFTGQAGRRIKMLLKQANALPQSTVETDNYADIVEWCKRHTGKGNACILSPAAASYDNFKNFEERGTVFTNLVLG